jgi:peptide-methionine (R)-S-oxide reductase
MAARLTMKLFGRRVRHLLNAGIVTPVADEDRMDLTDEEWRQRLNPEQFEVLRNKATDRPFSGEYTHPVYEGVFKCAGCGSELFSAETQFDSGSGWPSFTRPIESDRVELHEDRSYGMRRIEVTCSRCGGHLGHVFDDGPGPEGLRWCINSTSLELEGEKTR